ncbi:hypothetical protein D3C73_1515120 [compost metagenome]
MGGELALVLVGLSEDRHGRRGDLRSLGDVQGASGREAQGTCETAGEDVRGVDAGLRQLVDGAGGFLRGECRVRACVDSCATEPVHVASGLVCGGFDL